VYPVNPESQHPPSLSDWGVSRVFPTTNALLDRRSRGNRYFCSSISLARPFPLSRRRILCPALYRPSPTRWAHILRVPLTAAAARNLSRYLEPSPSVPLHGPLPFHP